MSARPSYVLRRAQFLLEEARHPECHRDQTITAALRVLSNHAAVKADRGSAGVKRHNTRLSVEAARLYLSMTFDQWRREVTNEHQWTLKQIWQAVRARAASLTPETLFDVVASYPMVTVTNLENEKLLGQKRAFDHDPEERYRQAGISVLTVPSLSTLDVKKVLESKTHV